MVFLLHSAGKETYQAAHTVLLYKESTTSKNCLSSAPCLLADLPTCWPGPW